MGGCGLLKPVEDMHSPARTGTAPARAGLCMLDATGLVFRLPISLFRRRLDR